MLPEKPKTDLSRGGFPLFPIDCVLLGGMHAILSIDGAQTCTKHDAQELRTRRRLDCTVCIQITEVHRCHTDTLIPHKLGCGPSQPSDEVLASARTSYHPVTCPHIKATEFCQWL